VTDDDVALFSFAGERLTDPDVDQILKYTGTEEDLDGCIKFEGRFRTVTTNLRIT